MGLIARLRRRLSGDGAPAVDATVPASRARAALVRGLALAAREWASAILDEEAGVSGNGTTITPAVPAVPTTDADPDGPPPHWVALVRQLRAERAAAAASATPTPAEQDGGEAGAAEPATRLNAASGDTGSGAAATSMPSRAFKLPSRTSLPRVTRSDLPPARPAERPRTDDGDGARAEVKDEPVAEGGEPVWARRAEPHRKSDDSSDLPEPAAQPIKTDPLHHPTRPANGLVGRRESALARAPEPRVVPERWERGSVPDERAGASGSPAAAGVRPVPAENHPGPARVATLGPAPPPARPTAAPRATNDVATGARGSTAAAPATARSERTSAPTLDAALPGSSLPARFLAVPASAPVTTPIDAGYTVGVPPAGRTPIADPLRSGAGATPAGASVDGAWAELPPAPPPPADELLLAALAESARRDRLDREQRGA